MKNFALIALALTVGVSCAFAASIKVPWFVDNAGVNIGVPPTGGNDGFLPTITLVYLASKSDTVLDCTIGYYSQEGVFLGPTDNGVDNTFVIAPFASVAFRPVASDPLIPGTSDLGLEATGPFGGNVIPDRPRDVDTKKNGSLIISYPGAPGDLGGMVQFYQQGTNRASAFGLSHALVPDFS